MNGKIKNIIVLLFVLFSYSNVSAQQTLQGLVVNKNKKKLSFVVVKVSEKDVIKYLFSDEKGTFKLEYHDTCTVTISALGYHSKKIDINSSSKKQLLIVLDEKPFHLEEVIIQSEKPIVIKNDTIRIKAKAFSNGTEQNVEELLAKIPGLQIDNEGTIKVGNQEIEKLMIDGDDFFEKGYKILSKNMPVHPIKEIEVLKNYSNNRLLKGVEKSDKVALNLKLDEKAKRMWFGNIETQTANADYYETKVNVMNFGKKNKYYFLGNINTLGADATGDISHLIRPIRYDEPAIIGDNQKVEKLLYLSPTHLSFSDNKNHFNNAKLVSLNAIFNPTEKLKIKTLGFFNWDAINSYRNRVENINYNTLNFLNLEDYSLNNEKEIAFGKLDVNYNISKTKMLISTTKYNYANFTDTANLLFNNTATNENLKSENRLFDQKINYTNKFGKKKVFLLTGRFINEEIPQKYQVNQYYFKDLFLVDADAVSQHLKNKMQFLGVDANLLTRRKNNDLIELQIGNEYRKDKLNTEFRLQKNDATILKPNNYQNNTHYGVNDLYLKGKYRFEFSKSFGITSKVDFHQLFNRLENDEVFKETPFFVNPSIVLDWEINRSNKISTSYGRNIKNSRILDVFNAYSLTSYRSILKGTGSFNQLASSRVFFSYQLGNWSDQFFANTFISYTKNHDFFSSQISLDQNYTETSKILVKDKDMLTINSKFDYYFSGISSNLKVNLEYFKSDFKNSVNRSSLREVTSENYTYGLELRSAFNGFFNYHIGTKWLENNVISTIKKSYRSNESFVDLFFTFNKKLNVQLQTDFYHFGNLETNKNYFFINTQANYQFIKNKLTLGISGRNLLNTKRFVNYSVNDIGTTTSKYRLLPRFVLLKIKLNFFNNK